LISILRYVYIAQVIRSKLANDGPQPVIQSEPKISLEALLGWLHLKARLEGVDIEKMKQLLFEFAEVEHQLIRFKQMVDKAESIGVAELNEQEQIDKNVMLKILLKIQQEEVTTKTALISLVTDSPKEGGSPCVFGSCEDLGENHDAAMPILQRCRW